MTRTEYKASRELCHLLDYKPRISRLLLETMTEKQLTIFANSHNKKCNRAGTALEEALDALSGAMCLLAERRTIDAEIAEMLEEWGREEDSL